MKSQKWTLNSQDLKEQLKNALSWLIPLVIVYLTQLQGTLQMNNGLSLQDFRLTSTTIGAMELYIFNQVYGLFNKWRAE